MQAWLRLSCLLDAADVVVAVVPRARSSAVILYASRVRPMDMRVDEEEEVRRNGREQEEDCNVLPRRLAGV